jgi:hypothetical protein
MVMIEALLWGYMQLLCQLLMLLFQGVMSDRQLLVLLLKFR